MGSTCRRGPGREIQPPQPEEDHRCEAADVPEAPGRPFERLYDRAHALQEAVRGPRGEPVEDALPLVADRPRRRLHQGHVRVHDPGDRPVALGGGLLPGRARVDRADRLRHRAGARREQVLGGERRPRLGLPPGEVLRALEPDVLGAPEQAPLLLAALRLGVPGPVEGPRRQLHDVEAVHGLGGARHGVGAAQRVGARHVARRLGDRGPVAAALLELVAEPARLCLIAS